jgi:sialic acid synthase SpsE/mannose-6-phosphate isomerase-like protein (cupin superfamily)
MKYLEKPLFTFEMANNHMGDVEHGILIVKEFGKLIKKYPEFNFSMKLQYRDNSFFHPDHIDRKDHKLIKRFTETRLADAEFKRIINEIHNQGFISMCTPWDAAAVDYQCNMGVQIIKVASCAFTDWPLLENIVQKDLPIIASTAGATEDDIKNVYTFLKNRNKDFAILHCVGEYPCINEHLDLNQIDYLTSRYEVPIGYSTHEDPNNFDSIKIAIGKGSLIFEKHVGVATDKYELNLYSANPEQADQWLMAAREAFVMCGGSHKVRKTFSNKEVADLRVLYRGAFAATDLELGTDIADNIFLAMPNIEGQLVAKELGKYRKYKTTKKILAGAPLMLEDLECDDQKLLVKKVYQDLKFLIENSPLILTKNTYIEISHHYGLDRFSETGAGMIHLINREYSKIIMIMLPGQSYPKHRHMQKDETYYVLYGTLIVQTDAGETVLTPGQTLSVERGVIHSFKTETGVVFEEIATTYIKGDSEYIDNAINENKDRKTMVLL